jgi:hypothetical protein
VRRVKKGLPWHPATDHLKGTSEYGKPCGETDQETFSIKFDHEDFDEFKFSTGDGKKWCICKKEEVYKTMGGLEKRWIESSSISEKRY